MLMLVSVRNYAATSDATSKKAVFIQRVKYHNISQCIVTYYINIYYVYIITQVIVTQGIMTQVIVTQLVMYHKLS